MRNPLTSALLAEQLKRLAAVFPSKLGSQNPAFTAEVYKDGLKGIDGDALMGAVDVCIQQDNYFPKIARLREAAGEWARRNRASFEPKREAAWNVCPVCGAKAERPMITRPKLYGEDTERYYVVAKESRTEVSLVLAGTKIPARDLLAVQARGIVLEMETLQSSRDVMNHNPTMHHVTAGEPGEYEGAA